MIDDFTQKLIIEQSLIGRVITQATTVEAIINAYIAEYYTRCPNGNYQQSYLTFISDVMNEQSVSLYAKINILYKIHTHMYGTSVPKVTKKLFEDWLSVRNKIAHGQYIADQGILYRGEIFDVQELTDKHAKLQLSISAKLESWAELRGPYFAHIPIKPPQNN